MAKLKKSAEPVVTVKVETMKISKGVTANLGNFESIRIDVEFAASVSSTDQKEIDSVFEKLSGMVDRKVNSLISEESGSLTSKSAFKL